MPAWARTLLIDAVKTISEEVAGLRAMHQTRADAQDNAEAPSSGGAEKPAREEKRTGDALRARIVELWDRASGTHLEDPERVVEWVEKNGQELLERTKTGWDSIARHIVDELVPDPSNEDAPRERSATVKRWDGLAKRIVERVVDTSLEVRGDRRGR